MYEVVVEKSVDRKNKLITHKLYLSVDDGEFSLALGRELSATLTAQEVRKAVSWVLHHHAGSTFHVLPVRDGQQ